MTSNSKILAMIVACLLFLSTFTVISRNFLATAQGSAELTGNIADSGKDTDGNGKYDSLEVAVEINVLDPGTYRVVASSLVDAYGYYFYSYTYNESSLPSGLQSLNLSFYGPAIYSAYFNPEKVSYIDLYVMHDGSSNFLGEITMVSLSQIYNYTNFDCRATLTGSLQDQGIDTDSDGVFDALQLGIEVNVLKNATYTVSVSGLRGDSAYVSVYNWSTVFLTVGIQTVNVWIYGPTIFSSLRDSGGNVSEVDYLSLTIEEGQASYEIDTKNHVSLSRSYVYYEFESHAYFTGRIFDNGVDENGDGLLDYLEVSVEANVTSAWNYTISIEGLRGLKNGTLQTVYDYHSLDVELSVGIHFVNFTFLGPMIAYNHLDPTNITGLRLSEQPDYYGLDYTYVADLPTRYACAEFNAPFTDTELELMVYPNATMCVKGNQSRTNMYPPMGDPRVNATVGFSTSGNVTTGYANGTVMLPEETGSEWPFNSATASLLANYYRDFLNVQLNASVFMPPEALDAYPFNSSSGDITLNAAYSNGIVDVDLSGTGQLCPEMASQFPFNLSDLRLAVSYVNKRISGNVTFRALGGFPMGDVVTNIEGNESDLSLSGSVNVTYSNLFGDPIGESNVTDFLSYLNNLTGVGDESLYNLTQGMVEFVSLDTPRTPQTWGEIVEYTAALRGNFTGVLAGLIANEVMHTGEAEPTLYAALNSTFSSIQNGTLWLNFYNASKIVTFGMHLNSDVKSLWSSAVQSIPSTLPDELRAQIEAILRIANATAYSVNNAQIQAVYSGEQQKLDLTISIEANATQLKNDIIPFISNATSGFMPQEFGDMFESFMNASYCKLDVLNLSANFTNGLAQFDADWTLQGDFEALVNHAKGFLSIMDHDVTNWEAGLLNSTEIDIGNLTFDVEQGDDWATMSFDGVRIYLSKNEIDPIRFTLYDWLNKTNDSEVPPKDFEKLKITLTSGFNGTHTILLNSPGTVSDHTTALDYKTMIWQNATIGSLRDLLFQVAYQGVVNRLGHAYYVPIFTNSTISGFEFDPNLKSLNFEVAGASGSGFCNVTIPRALLNASTSEWIVRLDDDPLAFNITENSEYVFIYFNYSHSTYSVEILGTWTVTEYQPNLLPPILAIFFLVIAIVAVKQRRKVATLKTKYQSAINNLIVKCHQLRA